MGTSHLTSGLSRRSILRSAAAAAAVSLAPGVYAAGSDRLKVGLVGCGGRGTGAAGQTLNADRGTVLWAMGDAFPDRLKTSLASLQRNGPERVQVTEDRCFTGLDAYKKVIESGIDVVLLCEPPGFRPAHIRYALEAGKHVFAEKPMAVDAPGVRDVAQSARIAKEKKLALVAGFNTRYTEAARVMMSRIHEGAIGDMLAMYTTFNTGGLWMFPRKNEWSDLEWQVRNWYYFTWLSGDHLVEQAVHNCDKLAWAMKDQAPATALALGGRQVRTSAAYGHIYDHFAVVYEWPNGTRGFVFARQQDNCANDVSYHFMATRGVGDCAGQSDTLRAHGGSMIWKYDGPPESGHQLEHNAMYASIRANQPINDGDRMVRSTLIAIMGRMAAYTGRVITWDQAMNSQENLMPQSLEWGPMPTPPIAMPGKTRFF